MLVVKYARARVCGGVGVGREEGWGNPQLLVNTGFLVIKNRQRAYAIWKYEVQSAKYK